MRVNLKIVPGGPVPNRVLRLQMDLQGRPDLRFCTLWGLLRPMALGTGALVRLFGPAVVSSGLSVLFGLMFSIWLAVLV